MYFACKRALAGALMALSLCACEDERAAGPAPSAKEPIRFGATLGLTSEMSAQAELLRDVLRAVEYQVNAAGGIEGRQVEILVLDDLGFGGEDYTLLVQQELLSRGVVGLIGPQRSDQALWLLPLLTDVAPMISGTVMSEGLTTAMAGQAPWAFRTLPAASRQARAMVQFARQGMNGYGSGCTKLRVLHVDDDYGQGMAQLLGPRFTQTGGTEVRSIALPLAAASYEAQLREAAQGTPGCLALVAYESQAVQLATELSELRAAEPMLFPADMLIIGCEQMFSDSFVERSRLDASNVESSRARGYFLVAPQVSQTDWGPQREFMSLYLQMRPGALWAPMFATSTYDAAALMMLARAAAGSDEPQAIRDAIRQVSATGVLSSPGYLGDGLRRAGLGEDINYNGASGPVDLDETGIARGGSFAVTEVRNGRLITLGFYEDEDLSR